MTFRAPWLLLGLLASAIALAQPATGIARLTTARATPLHADKLPQSPVLRNLPAGTVLRMLSLEGGWALVEPVGAAGAPGAGGWVRASTLNLPDAASNPPAGREAAVTMSPTPGVRSLPARGNRHALIIGIGRYADPAIPPLPGVRIDRQSATQMAQAMQVPAANISYLHDDKATGNAIRQALRDLTAKVQDGDRVFIHYSGHGTRYNDPAAGGCVEALLAYDGGPGGTITNREMADLLKTITSRTDKLFVMYDACHSGGLAQAASGARTRGLTNDNDEGRIRPKFSNITEECSRPVNIKTRNLLVEATSKGVLPQDIIHLSAARDNEISFDDEHKGGLATQFMRDCMLREARDIDNSGAISIDEIRQCAQEKINRRMANDPNFKPHNLVLNGNAAFVPAWFSQPSLTPVAAHGTPAIGAVAPTLPAGGTVGPVVPVVAPAPPVVAAPLTGAQALRQLFDQRDAKRRVQVTAARAQLTIGRDALELSVSSDRAGYVYVALAGSDNQSLYVLFPNEIDNDNRIEAGQLLQLPRPTWRVRAAGPPGTDTLLVLVSDGPRDLTALAGRNAGPFVTSLNDAQGRARLGGLMTIAHTAAGAACDNAAGRANNPLCSDAYGASMLNVEEVK